MGVWHASKVSREGCGQYCEADTCSDFWLTEFAWSGAEVTSGPFSVLGSQLTSRFSQISTFEEMPGRVSRAAYGYTSNAVSQAWQSRRCYSNCDGARCGGASSLHFDGVPHCSEASTADWIGAHTSCAANTTSTLVTMAFQEQELTPGVTSWTSGVPPSAEGVNRFYKCPTPEYNPHCVRIPDLAAIELAEEQDEATRKVIAWSVSLALCTLASPLFFSFSFYTNKRAVVLNAAAATHGRPVV